MESASQPEKAAAVALRGHGFCASGRLDCRLRGICQQSGGQRGEEQRHTHRRNRIRLRERRDQRVCLRHPVARLTRPYRSSCPDSSTSLIQRLGRLVSDGCWQYGGDLLIGLDIDWGAILLRGPVKVGDIKLAERVSTDDFGMTIAIFKDQVARPDFERNATELGYIPYRIKNPNVKPIGYLGVSEFDQINTEVGMSQSSDSIYSQPGFGYPFDIFKGVLTLVACNNNTITRLGRPGIDVMRLEGSILEDSLL